MASAPLSLLLIGICCLGLVDQSAAECCTSSEVVSFKMNRGECADVGGFGYESHWCEITICADGVKRVGSYCGEGSCNIFGCNCGRGCRYGDWSQSFVERNKAYGIEVRGNVRNVI
ncbi:protein Diedel [Drosophila biarmipes]|uniref:protein Diedel n=1 Tax=Drosophila biarmipes TaxID=125945 RepID=UPI0007E5F4E3|nr:protein Diedel [Drosophila biarmipes]